LRFGGFVSNTKFQLTPDWSGPWRHEE